MKYKNTNLSVWPFLTVSDLNNKWIWGNCKHVLNVSGKEQSKDVMALLAERNVTYHVAPLKENEELSTDDLLNAIKTLVELLRMYPDDEIIIHCIGGNNRSRMVSECALYVMTGEWNEDRFDSEKVEYFNHIEYNIRKGYIKVGDKTVTSLEEWGEYLKANV